MDKIRRSTITFGDSFSEYFCYVDDDGNEVDLEISENPLTLHARLDYSEVTALRNWLNSWLAKFGESK